MGKEFSLKDFFFGKLSMKFSTIFVFVALILTLIGTSFFYYYSDSTLLAAIKEKAATDLAAKQSIVDYSLANESTQFSSLANDGSLLQFFTQTGIGQEVTLKKLILLGYSSYCFVRTSGEMTLESNGACSNLAKSGIPIGDYISSSLMLEQNTPYIVSSTAVLEDGKKIGYLVAKKPANEIIRIISSAKNMPAGGSTFIISSASTEFYDTFAECVRYTSGSTNIVEHNGVVMSYTSLNGELCLVSRINSDASLSEGRKNVLKFSILILLVIMTGAALCAHAMSWAITKPIKQLQYAAEEVERRNFKVRVSIKTGDELENLGNAFNKTTTALERLDDEHKEIERAKTEFLSITSHELRSPMTPMKGQLEMLIGGYLGKLSPKQKKSLNMVLSNLVRFDGIVQDLLEISRIEAAQLNFKFEKTNLKKEISLLIEEMKHFLPEKKIKITLDIEDLPVVEADSGRVMQVLRNLLNNAKKYSPGRTSVQVSGKQEGGHIVFSVKDHGIGMSEGTAKRIFEPFFQGEQTIYRKYSGTGLGLSICKGIVEAQNGKIWVKSELGQGSTFYFTLPLQPVREIKPISLLFSQNKNS